MEKLYNNIILPDNFAAEKSDPKNVPYLKNPPEVIDVTVGRQLFVDDFLIEDTELVPEYHKAKKYEGNPIFYPVTDWEMVPSPVSCPKSGGVWYDEEEHLFKMWYEAGWLGQMCYAVSEDGIDWRRPDLGLEVGTNKILLYDRQNPAETGRNLRYLRPDSSTVFMAFDGPKEERYKLFLRNPGGKYPGIAAVSGDGIHFQKFRFTGEVFDRSTIFYNPFRRKWVYSIREVKENHSGSWWRCRSYRECTDYLEGAEWKPEEKHDWMETDDLDQPNPYIGFAPQLYNVDCVGYESIMLGMFQIMYGPENDVCETCGVPKITELIPMYSRDGYHFSRPFRESIIPASIYRGAWDRGYVQSVGGVLVVREEELWMYYAGFAGDEGYADQCWTDSSGMYRNGAVGIAKLRRDGFVSMNGKGVLMTRKFMLASDKHLSMYSKSVIQKKETLYINAEGSVQVEILDDQGMVMARSKRFEGDCTKARLIFENFSISELEGRVFRLRFQVDGKLYAFGFADARGDFGGAHGAGMIRE